MPNAQHINNALAAAYFESNDGMETVSELSVFLAYCEMNASGDYTDKNLAKMLEDCAEAYAGDFDSFADLAAQQVDEGLWGDIPEHLSPYIDYEAMGRDLRIGGDYYEHNGHFFRNF